MSNFHTHCYFCDGKGEPEGYILEALRKGFRALGFSCHAPIPFDSVWTMKDNVVNDYLSTMERLKEKYAGRIEIYTGLEIDYFDGDNRQIFTRYPVDYTIGSVHFFCAGQQNKYYSIDGTAEEFEETLNEYFHGDIRSFATGYYMQLSKMIKEHKPDILGHLDVLKKHNGDGKYFCETDAWYGRLIDTLLDTVKENGTIVEVNTGGLIRGYIRETYPSGWILQECRRREIPVVVNSDAHAAEFIDGYFNGAFRLLKEVGYTEQMTFHQGRWVKIPL